MLTPSVQEIGRPPIAVPTFRVQLGAGAKVSQGSAILAIRCAR